MAQLSWFSTPEANLPIHQLFGSDKIRVLLDFNKMLQSVDKWHVSIATAEDAALSVRPPWFWQGKNPARYDDLNIRNYTFRELAEQHFPVSLESGAPECLIAPCYFPTGGPPIILDGNHRLHAMNLRKPKNLVTLIAANGPIDPEILPDLAYWKTL